jgi:ABC-type multidrug transport system ATPase subunit
MTVQVPKASPGYKTMLSPLTSVVQAATTCGDNLGTRDFHRLDNISGVLRPGSMTLVLAPPGHGKSSLLKALSSRISVTAGSIVYNGLTTQEAAAQGCNTRRLTQYVDQTDEHLPLLTVAETLDFAHRVTCARYDPARVENTIKLLGLEECKDTILGNAMLRGVSGGQKRRVTLGEMLVGDACALFLDEYTNGLDTATSEDITRGLRRWVKQTNGMIVTSLQQPTPGLYVMFDNIIVLRDAQIVYDGPRADLEPFFASMGFACPEDVDVCDFVIDCMSQPRVALQRLRDNERRAARAAAKAGEPPAVWRTTSGEQLRAEAPCVTTAQMVAHYKASPMWARNSTDLDRVSPPSPLTAGANADANAGVGARACEPLMPCAEMQQMYKTGYTLPLSTLFAAILRRQWAGVSRNSGLVISRLVQTAFMGLLYGSLYWQIPPESFFLRVSVFLISQIQVIFGSLAELPASVGGNRIVFKQAGASFYPTYMYALAAAVCGLPVCLVETAVLSLLLYFMTDCVREASHFFVFYAVTLMTMVFMTVWMRLLSSLARDEGAANAIAGPSTGMFNMFGGFYVTMNSLPVWMRWVMWCVR